MDDIDHESDFKPRPQQRREGSGRGRRCRNWQAIGWLLIAAERVCVKKAGGETAILKSRQWSRKWGITPDWLKEKMEHLFPGIVEYIESTPGGQWGSNGLKNRVYKMYYYGSSARGPNHDPNTRAAPSPEHWRSKSYRRRWEKVVIQIVQRDRPYRQWRRWL